MHKGWTLATLFGACLTLAGCCPPMVSSTPVPCYTHNYLPNNAMGRLGIRVITVGEDVRIILPSNTIFAITSSEIRDEAYPGLTMLAKWIKENYGMNCMTIVGYTDDLALPSENKFIAEQQARAIQTFLWTQGFPHQLITPFGIGEDSNGTVASNRSVLGSAANRRVEITFRSNRRNHVI
jgi:outer membrane protein OmpA-like peptidoglycan-associated protein